MSAPFTPTTSARWINALFFVSLVLSLAAALFGILAKQWLREYMQWNSPLSVPRENILVRQMRFEAWEAWNVAATIASIPALLEFAMVLFLIGVIILLWSLDDVVATVVTIVITTFLSIVSFFTILPIIFQRCPYRSPTAWACVAAMQFIFFLGHNSLQFLHQWAWSFSYSAHNTEDVTIYRRFVLVIKNLIADSRETFREYQWSTLVLGTWRTRELRTCRPSTVRLWGLSGRQSWNIFDVALEVIRNEEEHLRTVGVPGSSSAISDQYDMTSILRAAVGETSLLLRALSWVQRSSQDLRVETYIGQCVGSVFRTNQSTPVSPHITLLITLCCVHSAGSKYMRNPHLSLCRMRSSHRSKLAESRARLGAKARALPGTEVRGGCTLVSPKASVLHREPNVSDELIATPRLLSVEFRRAVGGILDGSQPADHRARMAHNALDWLLLLSSKCPWNTIHAADWLSEETQAVVCDPKVYERVETLYPGFRHQVVYLACQTTSVDIDEAGNLGAFALAVEQQKFRSHG